MQEKPVIIAVCGKGGVGKTSISALMVRMLSEDPSKKVLAIDGDPAVGLSFPLGITVKKTVDDIRNDLIRRLKNGEQSSKEELIKSLDYELFSALEERKTRIPRNRQTRRRWLLLPGQCSFKGYHQGDCRQFRLCDH
jgi:CO dehydrogenase maturation factor